MASFYYVTSLTWRLDRPIHLRWFRVFESRKDRRALADTALTPSKTDVDWQEIIDEFLSYEEAAGVAGCLQSLGHEAIAIHELSLPLSSDGLADILLSGGNLYLPSIEGTGSSSYWAYTMDVLPGAGI